MHSADLRGPAAVLLALVFAGCAEAPSTRLLEPDETSLVRLSSRGPEARARQLIITGPWSAAGPQVNVFDGLSSSPLASFFAYDPSFLGGVRVAAGDVDGDGVADVITGAGPGAGPHVKVFSAGGAQTSSFFAYSPAFTGGVFVAAGDVTGDGTAEIVTGAGAGGGPHVKVFGSTGVELASFLAYAPTHTGGVTVAAGDVDGDGRSDVITGAGPGGGPHVKVFSGATDVELRSFFAYDPAFTGGVYVAAGDVNGDGRADVVTGAGAGGAPHVKVFDGATGAELLSFLAYAPDFDGGVSVAAVDIDGDGRADVVTGPGAGAGPHVKVFSGATGAELASFYAYAPEFVGGVFVTAGDAGSLPVETLVDAAWDAATDGTLVGAGNGASAEGRLGAWLSMLEEAAALLEAGDVDAACGQLRQAYRRADGDAPPPDFVDGPARATLADAIVALMDELGCSAQ